MFNPNNNKQSPYGTNYTPSNQNSNLYNTAANSYQQPIPFYNQTPNQNGIYQPNRFEGNYGGQQQPKPRPYKTMNQPYWPTNAAQVYGNEISMGHTYTTVPPQQIQYQARLPPKSTKLPESNEWGHTNHSHTPPAHWGKQQLNSYGKQVLDAVAISQQPLQPQQSTELTYIVEQMFMKYDLDRSGTLDKKQIVMVFNEVLARFNIPITLDAGEAEALMYQIDKNSDGTISPQELYQCLKNLVVNEMQEPF